MKFPLTTGKAANFSARHPWWVIGVWLVFIVLAAVATPGLKTALAGDEMRLLNNPDSVQGQTLLDQKMSGTPTASSGATETVVVHSDTTTINDSAFQKVVQNTTAALVGKTGTVAQAYNYYEASLLDASAANSLVSADKHTTLIVVTLAGTSAQVSDNLNGYLVTVKAQNTPGYVVATIGDSSIGHEFTTTAESDLRKAEMIGLPITLLVLVFVFGALLAAGVSLSPQPVSTSAPARMRPGMASIRMVFMVSPEGFVGKSSVTVYSEPKRPRTGSA